MASSSTMSRRRPKRQRTPTTIYTDENPMTFTTKKKKGQNGNGHSDDDNDGDFAGSASSWQEEDSISMPPPASVSKRGPGRPPRKRHSDPGGMITRGVSQTTTATTTQPGTIHDSINASSSSSSTTSTPVTVASTDSVAVGTEPVKRKRGRPPKNRPKEMTRAPLSVDPSKSSATKSLESPSNPTDVIDSSTVNNANESPRTKANESSHGGSIDTRRSTLAGTQSNKSGKNGRRSLDSLLDVSSSDQAGTKRRSPESRRRISLLRAQTKSVPSWTPPQRDKDGTFVAHSVTLAPILPPILVKEERNNDSTSKDANERESDANEKSATREDCSEESISRNASRRHRELESRYPFVFEEGVPRESSSIAKPFSSTGPLHSAGASNSKHKVSPSQHPLPSWTPLQSSPVFFDDDYDRETGELDVNTLPVTRHITAMAVRKPNHDYLILGDSVGFVTIYSLRKDNIHLPIAQLESVACQQRGKPEQDRLREDIRKRTSKQQPSRGKSAISTSTTPKFHGLRNSIAPTRRSIVIDTSDTEIHALGMIENRVVLATSVELECMDVPSGTSLWVCPLSSNRFVTSLDMHLHTFDVLVSCSKEQDASTDLGLAAPISPLMLLQHSKNNVEICDANSPLLVRSPSCTAIWDIGANNRLLFIALSSNRQEHELVLVSGGSIDAWKVACKTKIPTIQRSVPQGDTKLSQSPGGQYTLVASSRGIRLYQTESLQLLHVYGDQLALHGQSLLWKDCWLAGSYFYDTESKIKAAARGLPSEWLQSGDWLGGDETQDSREKGPDLAPYIVGVPHTKGPKELVESLHVWKVDHPSVVPAMSIPLPPKSEGALGLVGSGHANHSSKCGGIMEDSLVLVTIEGEGHLLAPKMESNFAGMMYPPGYQVVTNNLDFIEAEDALDGQVSQSADDEIESEETLETSDPMIDSDSKKVGDSNESFDDEFIDEELREAMRQSLLEHKKQEIVREAIKHDTYVDILVPDTEKEPEYLPCRPEPYLRQMISDAIDDEDDQVEEREGNASAEWNGERKENPSPENGSATGLNDAIFISNVLDVMPNMQKPKPLEEDLLSFTTTKVVVAVNPVLPARPGRGRKARTANLETMLKASVNPYLQSMMISKQGVASNGHGSKLGVVKMGKVLGASASEKKPVVDVVQRSISPREATNDDEAAVVMGLLGLSPCHSSNVTKNMFDKSSQSSNAFSKPSAQQNSSTFPYLDENSHQRIVTMSTPSVEVSENGKMTAGRFEGGTTDKPAKLVDPGCSACRGRHVIHSCGKRSLPIDYEEIARAEKERKEKEEEEKKRIRAEKRRLADQRRREAKKQKQREIEAQRQREERERLQIEEQRRLQEDFASQDHNKRRRDQIVASYANHVSMDQLEQGPTTQIASSVELIRVNKHQEGSHIHQGIEASLLHTIHNANTNGDRSSGRNLPLHLTNGGFQEGVHLSASNNTAESAGTSHLRQSYLGSGASSNGTSGGREFSITAQSALVQAALPSVSATLASADALLGLANLADSTKTLPVTDSNPSINESTANQSVWLPYNSYSYPPEQPRESTQAQAVSSISASHGFGAARPDVSESNTMEKKRGIPSYATIRGQYDR